MMMHKKKGHEDIIKKVMKALGGEIDDHEYESKMKPKMMMLKMDKKMPMKKHSLKEMLGKSDKQEMTEKEMMEDPDRLLKEMDCEDEICEDEGGEGPDLEALLASDDEDGDEDPFMKRLRKMKKGA
jgi:hypothetical protein